jgi:hypothetical protein
VGGFLATPAPVLLPIQNGGWNIETGTNNGTYQFILRYNYIANGGTPQNFSTLSNIQITSNISNTISTMTLGLTDINSLSISLTGSFSSGVWTWNLSSFPLIDKTRIIAAEFLIDVFLTSGSGVAVRGNLINLRSSVVCLAKNTQILLANGDLKLIQNIKRGDLVAADLSRKEFHKVANIPTQILDSTSAVDLLVFQKNCLGDQQPNQNLLITPNHPIIYNGKRRPAKCFQNLNCIDFYQRTIASDILPVDDETGKYILYDLQFESDGSYVANGVVVQSRSPYSEITPLPRELYFNSELYTDERVSDTYDHPLSLDTTILTQI